MTFFATLIMAPSLASGILLGVGLTVLWYLIQIMRPRAEIVARKTDGTLGGIRAHQLQPISKAFVPVRFDGSLSFINVAYFEDILLEAHADFPRAEAILIIGSGVNQIDVSGEEKIRELTLRLKEVGVTLMFSGLKHQVMKVFERGGLIELIGRENFFSDKETALHVLTERYGVNSVAAEPKPA
jgi:MFS superfamily sulfate permease-like transporter